VSKKAREHSRVQRKLAEVQRQQRARQRRIRILIGVPAAIAVATAVAVVAVLFTRTHGTGTSAAGSAMAAAERTGASGLNGPVLSGLDSAAQGSTVHGIQCSSSEQTVYHIHAHLAVFVNGAQRTVPYGIGIPGRDRHPETTRRAVRRLVNLLLLAALERPVRRHPQRVTGPEALHARGLLRHLGTAAGRWPGGPGQRHAHRVRGR